MLENILLGIVSVCTFISYFPQMIKCFKSKELEDLSIASWILWVVSSLAYTLYAFLCTDSFMLIFETCLELGFCLIIMTFAIIYREKPKKNIEQNTKIKIYVMRHGMTVWNENGIIQGHSKNRLSVDGVSRLKRVAKKYKNCNIDAIYASPLMRTMQTANIINKYHNVPIFKDDRLIEINQGIFTGRRKDSITPEEEKLRLESKVMGLHNKKSGIESFQSVYDRVEDFINELKSTTTYKNILIVTHNINASFISDIFENVDIDFNNDKHIVSFDNAEIKSYEIEGE